MLRRGMMAGGAYALNPADQSGITLSNSNRTATKSSGGAGHCFVRAISGKAAGKWYWEVQYVGGSPSACFAGAIATSVPATNTQIGLTAGSGGYLNVNGLLYYNGTNTAYGATYTDGAIISVALDMDAGKVWFAKNNTWQASGNPAAGTAPAISGLTGTWFPAIGIFNQGGSCIASFAAADQSFSPPSGFTAIGG